GQPWVKSVDDDYYDLTRLSTQSCKLIVEIIPTRVFCKNQPDFPSPAPVLHVVLALDRDADIVVAFRPNQALQSIFLREAVAHPLAVLPDTPREITGHTDIEGAVRPVRDDVDPSALHQSINRRLAPAAQGSAGCASGARA